MAEYTLSNTAVTIDTSISRVANADTAPQSNSANMVTSGGVYSAVNNIDLTNLASGVLTTEADGIANFDTDGNIPTNAAVKDYVDTTSSTIQSGVTALITDNGTPNTDQSTSGTASTAGFIIATGTTYFQDLQFGADIKKGLITVTVGGITYTSSFGPVVSAGDAGNHMFLNVPIASGEAYSITIQGDDKFARFKELS